eukprot:gnl/Dysnectes_brevis/26_a32_13179.p1 GENE.gnl/Dysnectes_brevis/26_a32_13179~~gnl/Dysnectes_brevis/26_a32_13179.p1  ORF type:complete len:185 (+),score=44.82 gnl/Dysnectes_brevis/26_a32_13179:31-585(+)
MSSFLLLLSFIAIVISTQSSIPLLTFGEKNAQRTVYIMESYGNVNTFMRFMKNIQLPEHTQQLLTLDLGESVVDTLHLDTLPECPNESSCIHPIHTIRSHAGALAVLELIESYLAEGSSVVLSQDRPLATNTDDEYTWINPELLLVLVSFMIFLGFLVYALWPNLSIQEHPEFPQSLTQEDEED